MIYESQYYSQDFLAHHGVKGMKWGVRKYQNPDGTLTAEGKKRYYDKYDKLYDRYNSVEGMRRRENKSGRLQTLGGITGFTAAALGTGSMPIALLSSFGGVLGGAAVSRAKKLIDAKRYKKIGTLLGENTNINDDSNESDIFKRINRNYERGTETAYSNRSSDGVIVVSKTKNYDNTESNKKRTYMRFS